MRERLEIRKSSQKVWAIIQLGHRTRKRKPRRLRPPPHHDTRPPPRPRAPSTALPRLPPLASFPRRQESRGAVPGRGNPVTNPCRFPRLPPLAPFPRSQQPKGPAPLSSFLRRQESRGAVPGRGNPATNPCRFPDFPRSRRSRVASNPEGPARARNPFPPRGGRLGWGAIPHSRHSCESSNPEGPCQAARSPEGNQRARPATVAVSARTSTDVPHRLQFAYAKPIAPRRAPWRGLPRCRSAVGMWAATGVIHVHA